MLAVERMTGDAICFMILIRFVVELAMGDAK
jgi:hypothetical protein